MRDKFEMMIFLTFFIALFWMISFAIQQVQACSFD